MVRNHAWGKNPWKAFSGSYKATPPGRKSRWGGNHEKSHQPKRVRARSVEPSPPETYYPTSKHAWSVVRGLWPVSRPKRYSAGMGQWVDTHCHLQLDGREPGPLLERAADVRCVVVPGVDLRTSRDARALARLYPKRVFFAAGLHPHDATRWEEQRKELVPLMNEASAIGETGLDFYRNLAPRTAQLQSFVEHHRVALDTRKPLIVHCRDAFREIYEVLDREGSGHWVVLHCWTGGPRWSKRFVELGVTFSFAGPVTFETGDTVRRGAAVVPPSRVVVETDTPYLAPVPHRGEPNEPAHVSLVGAALARVWGMDTVEVARLTSNRATRVFGL